jgi:hypothetical protein
MRPEKMQLCGWLQRAPFKGRCLAGNTGFKKILFKQKTSRGYLFES